ncbi:dTDP-4-dehydrorhamnose reductase [Algoriphagus marinus]|uniref:dTDP-4-dehydrorhamnose reductase n=1 Tax=Algoriphagus marinus TaxID=1925762 RepID=UPI00094BAFF8|nr:dTDP-4-dehydrorhamnose reductase [Algoriphagus marinus]
MHKVLVTGANGQLGSEIRYLSPNFSFEFIFSDVEDLDITEKEKVHKFLVDNRINSIVNCAAYTAVDRAEADFDTADKVNHLAVKYLAESAKELNIKLVHVSTDYVFNGEAFQPYIEDSRCDPRNVYGISKRSAEEAILFLKLPNSVIIRTSWVYSSFGNNFVKTMRRLGSEKSEISVIADQIGSPTYARDLASCILEILPKISSEGTEIYHFSNEGVSSWYDFSIAIMELSGYSCLVNPIPSSQYPTPAKRPFYSVMDKSKIKREFGIKIPYWRESLLECLKVLG